MTGEFTREEIYSQPSAWSDALDVMRQKYATLSALVQAGKYDSVIFTGCGSTYYLSLAAATLFQQLNHVYARALPASEIWLNPASSFQPQSRTLLVAVSRSGETTETLYAVEKFNNEASGDVITLSCYGEKSLAHAGDINLVLPSGQERSIAQTRAFSVLYLSAVSLAASFGSHSNLLDELAALPEIGERLIKTYADQAVVWGRKTHLERFYFLGSGARYGLACELNLKMKEMSLTHSEPFHFMEFRHGPQSMVTPETLIFGLLSGQNYAHENQVLTEMRQRGAHVLSLGEDEADIELTSGLSEAARNVLYLPFGQIMAYERSLAKGLNPDRPNNLDAVVRLNGST
ncbi:MAG: SIS domain-containing protein [Anaerolineae bacterium]